MNNEEKILSILEKQSALLEKHDKEISKINITIENVIVPQLQALAEGQKTILETLAPKSRVDALGEEVEFLKDIIKMHTSQINDLRKAQ